MSINIQLPGDRVAVSLGNKNWAEKTIGVPYRTDGCFTNFSFSCFPLSIENTCCVEDRETE